jgi:hypothetical protein
VSEIVLSDEARKAISRWTRDEFYVYIRPVTSRFLDRSSKHKIYWQVSVEYRHVDFRSRRAEGYDLNDVILTLAKDVPRRKDIQPGYVGVGEDPKKKMPQYPTEAEDFTGKPREDKPKVKKKSKKKKKASVSKDADVIPIDRPRKRTKEAKKVKKA